MKKYPNKLGRIAAVFLWFADRFEKELIFKTAYVLSLLQKDWVKEKFKDWFEIEYISNFCLSRKVHRTFQGKMSTNKLNFIFWYMHRCCHI